VKWAILCDGSGRTTLGTDGKIPLDGRLGRWRALNVVEAYRDSFRAHFPHKVERWSHVMFTRSITGEGQPIRLRD